jgi:hypothetical protein
MLTQGFIISSVSTHMIVQGNSFTGNSNDLSTSREFELSRDASCVRKLDGYCSILEPSDGWVYFASLQMDHIELLILNMQTLASMLGT